MLTFLLAAVIATVHGRVLAEGIPLPHVEVTIGSVKTVTDVNGSYTLTVAPGSCEIKFHLAGFDDDSKKMSVQRGENTAEDETMRPTQGETITVACSGACGSMPPISAWDRPLCSDWDLDTTLEKAAKRGDHSAIDLLESRYEVAFTFREKRLIAGILLNRATDDSKYWKWLFGPAEDALRFIGQDDATRAKLQTFASEKGVNPEDYRDAALDALQIVCADVRSRPLLRRALDSADPDVQTYAVIGFSAQRDESVLDAIDAVIRKAPPSYQSDMAKCLIDYRSEAADKIAFQYLSDDERAEYIAMKPKVESRGDEP